MKACWKARALHLSNTQVFIHSGIPPHSSTMYGSNPFAAQDAWNAASGQSTGAPPPSVFGALPYPTASSQLPDAVTFTFTSFNPTILNCKVVGPRNETYFRVVTEGGYTMLKNARGSNIALLGWQDHPTIEAPGLVTKQPVRHWLRLSAERKFV